MAKAIAIGASQGGVEALRAIAADMPRDFPAALLVVLHVGNEQSILPSILQDAGPLDASHAVGGEEIRPGHFHVAPPDHHMLVVDGHLALTRGPRENWVRPAIDPLFRTVGEAYGRDAAGVVLTGRLNDGTSGLFELKRRGGTAIVQAPATAEAPSMPQSALENVPIDFCVSVEEIPRLLVRLANEEENRAIRYSPGGREMPDREVVHRAFAQTCPECGGAMRQEEMGTLTRFRCHIGHVMTAEVLAAAQLECLEKDLGAAFRFLNERRELCQRMAEKHFARGNKAVGEFWASAAEEATEREALAKAASEASWLRPEVATEG
jgi:two-component system chemotaxis response regulator CheB